MSACQKLLEFFQNIHTPHSPPPLINQSLTGEGDQAWVFLNFTTKKQGQHGGVRQTQSCTFHASWRKTTKGERKGHEVKNPEFGQGHFDNRPHRSDSTSHLLLTGFTRQNAVLPADVKTAKAKVICEGFLSPPIQLVQVKSNHFLWVRVALRCGFTPRTSSRGTHCPLTRTWCHSTPT